MQARQLVVDPLALPRPATSLFHAEGRLLWIEGHDLLQDDRVWLPYECVHADYMLPFPTGSGCFAMTSNGLGSGNCVLEAISHGICEVIERDAERLWDLRDAEDQQRTRMSISSIDDPDCCGVLALMGRAGVDVAIWDITSDVGLPVFHCLIGANDEEPVRAQGVAVGSGSHPDRSVALLRALTEAAQSRLTRIAGSRDDIESDTYVASDHADIQARNRAWLHDYGTGRAFAGVPSRSYATLDEDVDWELERLRDVGIERVVVADLSHPDLALAVVRVVIPGLEGPAVVPDLLPGKRARALIDAAR